uniref:(northern house mosquito) hypothetical protein n=1 Tax=Culex pipiens TaxID=7175 RepID=A0A8D8FR39_CULPI
MVALNIFPELGRIYAFVVVVGRTSSTVKHVSLIVNGNGGEIIVVMKNLIWILTSVVLLIGIIQKSLTCVKMYRTFYVVAALISLMAIVTAGITSLDKVDQIRLPMKRLSFFAVVFVFCVLATCIIWILNGIIRYIESEKKIQVKYVQNLLQI